MTQAPLGSRTDAVAERAARWLAARSTRRGFLGGVGKAALLAAGGSLVADAFRMQADARVCGQSGVAPKCPTYDCDAPNVWGYCWYASPGCCIGGGLKKICDCCRADWDFVHGYCPDGTNVYCAIESCLEDPRVMATPVLRIASGSADDVAVARTAPLAAGSARIALLVQPDPLVAAISAPLAARLGAPLLPLEADGSVGAVVAAELVRLAVAEVWVVGPAGDGAPAGLPASVAMPRRLTAGDPAATCAEVAAAVQQLRPVTQVIAVGTGAAGRQLAPAASAFAAAVGGVLALDSDAVTAVQRRLTEAAASGTSPAGDAGATAAGNAAAPSLLVLDESVRGGDGLRGGLTAVELSAELAAKAAAGVSTPMVLTAAPLPDPASVLAALMIPTTPPGALVLYTDQGLGVGMRPVVRGARGRVVRAEVLLTGGVVSNDPRVFDLGNRVAVELQSDLHGFDEHLLTGLSGEGLPVIAQTLEERERGRARVSGQPAAPPTTVAVASRAAKKAVARSASKAAKPK